jgi:inorganic pyrophosphatase/exopolyphosphatase
MSLMQALRHTARARGPALARFLSCGGDHIKVFGHKNPDTDATCGAIIRAFELEQRGALVLGLLRELSSLLRGGKVGRLVCCVSSASPGPANPELIARRQYHSLFVVCFCVAGQKAKPYVLGGLNKETEYVLKRFAVETPPLLGPLTACKVCA